MTGSSNISLFYDTATTSAAKCARWLNFHDGVPARAESTREALGDRPFIVQRGLTTKVSSNRPQRFTGLPGNP
jgi:hypothetical protein